MKIRKIKRIISYMAAMIFSVVFGLFLDANVGWFILLTLILAPVISVFLAWISSRMLTVSSEMEDMLLSKGDTCSMTVTICNKAIFPTPPLDIKVLSGDGVRSKDKSIIVSVMPKMEQCFDIIFKAKICGRSVVGIDAVYVTDYLGLFYFPIKKADYDYLKRKVAVIPDIAEISARDDSIVKVMQTSLNMDDGEDTVESASYTFGGFPGYDNRDYEPGDPLKRINWKQSAKRNRLLVRLDDEMASQAVNVVLDSVFVKNKLDMFLLDTIEQYRYLENDEIIPKIAEDAVENALGIMQILVKHNYKVNFYAMMDNKFSEYEIADESDLEAVRLELANYSFSYSENINRLPIEDTSFKEKVSIFSTPNRYEDAYAVLERETDMMHTTIYSVLDEAKIQNNDNSTIFISKLHEKQVNESVKPSIKQRITALIKSMAVPYLLAVLLSTVVFGVFDIPVISLWTVVQMFTCGAIMLFCEYVKRHRVIGTLLMIVFIMGILNVSARLAYQESGMISYMYWFLSGGESVETTSSYLMTLLLIFTVFFSMVIYYFSNVLYRTSFLLLVSLIPFVINVKVMQDINMVQVVLITTLNVAAFLVNSRTQRDKGKRIVGYLNGLASLGLYAVIFIMIGLAVPEAETKYYYLFENFFLGGNVTVRLPQEYSEMSDYSGNADGFNELNNRKLYVIKGAETNSVLYLKRQTFDLYDFENHRWYPVDYYSEPFYSHDEWEHEYADKSMALLIEALNCAEEHSPGVFREFGLQKIQTDDLTKNGKSTKSIRIETTNFPSVAYITPNNSVRIVSKEDVSVSRMGVFQNKEGLLPANHKYSVEYYDENEIINKWVTAGGANFDYAASLEMLKLAKSILDKNNEYKFSQIVELYITEAESAKEYSEICEENNELIPESVKNLALEITKDCTYEWEKAVTLQSYFKANDFVYDLSYKAPDDSVEYFLFEGRTGTCSDFASAYVLMARSVGLTVRYAEGFVPKKEYNGDYVVRTNNGHAYPEVYIPNVGFVVIEATQPARYGEVSRFGNGAMAYILAVVLRVFAVFALICTIILLILFINLIVAPYIKEAYFCGKIKKMTPDQAVVMLYKRIQKRCPVNIIKNARGNTPYEYAKSFELLLDYDISDLTYMVEQAVYAKTSLNDTDRARAAEVYHGAMEAVKEKKKNGRKVN